MARRLLKPEIPQDELRFETARSAGPGGQNVNKVETKVTLVFDVSHSPSLTTEQKERVVERLATRISKAGLLRISAQRHRSQSANREEVVERLTRLLNAAFEDEAERKPTRKPRAAHERRRAAKRHRSTVKDLRGRNRAEEEA